LEGLRAIDEVRAGNDGIPKSTKRRLLSD